MGRDVFDNGLMLPLLQQLSQRYEIRKRRPFKNYTILAVQHVLGSTVPLFHCLEAGGVDKSRMFIIGKAYSSHPYAIDALRASGYHVNVAMEGYTPFSSYENTLQTCIRQTLLKLIQVKNPEDEPVLLIDDAGKAIQLLHTEFETLAHQFKCVEQTTRGIRALNNISLSCPVINVARSRAKILYEAPLIAESMILELIKGLKQWNDIFSILNHTAFLIGYGTIGKQVAARLIKMGFHVIVFDNEPTNLLSAQEAGYTFVRDRLDGCAQSGLIIGCTGSRSLPPSDWRMLNPGTLLVNMASSDIEFEPWYWYHQATPVFSRNSDGQISSNPWQNLYRIDLGETFVFLANGGFPIDFSGDIDPIPPSQIQLTRALLLGGALQVINCDQPGIIEMDNDIQELILGIYGSLQGNLT